MKLIIYSLCSFTLIFALTLEETKNKTINYWMKMMEPYENDCTKETGATVEDVRNAYETLIFPDDEKLKCYFKCQQMHLHFLDADNNFNVPEMAKRVAGADAEMLNKCIREIPNHFDICSRAQSLVKCCATAVSSIIEKRY